MGEIITFVDADDELVPDAIELAVSYIEKEMADVVVYGWDAIDEKLGETVTIKEEPAFALEKSVVLKEALKHYSAYGGGYPWNKLWRIDSLVKEQKAIPEFLEELFFFEDLEWVVRMLLAVEKVAVCPHSLYKYYIREESVTRKGGIEEEKALSYHQAINLIIQNLDGELKKWFREKYIPEIVNGVIDAKRKKQDTLCKYLMEKTVELKFEMFNLQSVSFNIKARYILLIVLNGIGFI